MTHQITPQIFYMQLDSMFMDTNIKKKCLLAIDPYFYLVKISTYVSVPHATTLSTVISYRQIWMNEKYTHKTY